jgi:hypothetical protein
MPAGDLQQDMFVEQHGGFIPAGKYHEHQYGDYNRIEIDRFIQ